MAGKSPPFKRLYDNYTENASGCWLWSGQCGSSGYGQIKCFGKFVLCHRLSYELNHGEITKGMEVMHQCHNRLCINPDHLDIGTHAENMKQASQNNSWSHVKRTGVSGINKSQSKPVIALGNVYGSINEAEKTLGKRITYWLKNNPEKANFITREQYYEAIK